MTETDISRRIDMLFGAKMRRLDLSFVFSLVVGLLFITIFCCQTTAQTEHTIETRGQTWNHSLIRVCIISQENQSWWKPEYLDSAINGIAMWNDAIQEFSLNYPAFGYLSQVSLAPTITTEPADGYDIYTTWIAECELESTIGQTRLFVIGSCYAINSSVCLAAKAPSGHIMSAADMQNIVVHELGHNFGLSHCSYFEDAMYAVVQYRETVKPLSNLNLYAVSQNFGWMANSTQFNATNPCPQETTLSLPSNIPYSFFAIATENMPTVKSESFVEQLVEAFETPEILIVLTIGAAALFVVTIIVVRSRKQKMNSRTND